MYFNPIAEITATIRKITHGQGGGKALALRLAVEGDAERPRDRRMSVVPARLAAVARAAAGDQVDDREVVEVEGEAGDQQGADRRQQQREA